jgi:4'-phosphopantetheinyl transferase
VDELPASEVHVWLCDPESADGALCARCGALLDEAERARRERFHFDRHRRRFEVSHALVRRSLSRYAPAPPEAWRFREVGRGRPEVAGPEAGAGLRFNLSHTDGLAACGVVRELDLGVDVEAASRVRRHLEIAERFFSPRESAGLRALPAEQQPGRFLDLWTLKESYIKGRGLGLALPLDGFSFLLEEGAPRLLFERDLEDRPDDWQFSLSRPTAGHRLAVAVRRGRRPALRIRVARDEEL